MGAFAYVIETTTANAAGRITVRNLSGRTYNYSYDAQGRLTAYTDDQDAANNATYEYDFAGRRVEMTVGTKTTRMVYDGDEGESKTPRPFLQFIQASVTGCMR